MTDPMQSATAGVSLVTLAVAFFGPQVGPYVAITLGGTGGALWVISSVGSLSRLAGLLLLIRCVVTSIVLTSVIALILEPWMHIPVTEAYSGVAFGLALMGNRWIGIMNAVKVRVQQLILTGGKP